MNKSCLSGLLLLMRTGSKQRFLERGNWWKGSKGTGSNWQRGIDVMHPHQCLACFISCSFFSVRQQGLLLWYQLDENLSQCDRIVQRCKEGWGCEGWAVNSENVTAVYERQDVKLELSIASCTAAPRTIQLLHGNQARGQHTSNKSAHIQKVKCIMMRNCVHEEKSSLRESWYPKLWPWEDWDEIKDQLQNVVVFRMLNNTWHALTSEGKHIVSYHHLVVERVSWLWSYLT